MLVWVGEFGDSTVNAVAGVGGTNLAPGTAGLTVNINGAFFNSTAGVGVGADFHGGTDIAKAFILLHELAHLTGAKGFLDNDKSEDRQRQNNLMILQHCRSTINWAAGQ